ncbi:unnamed protein product [Bursaphelenchus xylophilus]|uniref:(pine wood nematode) hypothetical protein n=1 Tax=Bursaphelenchus xylophilus TaxID=6326 RepID=A0A1I7SJ17_BURXY|nr:unnamed protein product [Bursaphelenchus xylophilus]CAG9126538.1 unnamed protein product [Bursaphelenchus xylophilus]
MLVAMVLVIVLQCISAQNPECRDRIPCTFMKHQCQNQFLQSTMRRMCQQTCGFCQETECKDYNTNCDLYQRNNMCMSDFIRNSCKKSCGLCRDNDHTKPPVTEESITDITDATEENAVTDWSLENTDLPDNVTDGDEVDE